MSKKAVFTFISYLLFVFYLVWWLWMHFYVEKDSPFHDYYADSYGIIAGIGGLLGFYVSRKWGLLKSFVGKSIIFLSAGLFSQFLGQLSYTILFYIYHIENAYPSFGEIFFLASIPLYALGIWYIGKASGLSISLKSFKNRIGALMFPILMIVMSYFLFLRNYDYAGVPIANILLDFFYPIGEAFFVSLAILTFFMTKDLLGGIMKKRVLFILFSLVFQYVADTLFIYETRSNVWIPGGRSDLMFVISYFLMTVGLLTFDDIEKALRMKKV